MDATEVLFDLIPLFEKKISRPITQQSKTGLSPMQVQTLTTLQKKNTCTMTALANEMLMPKQQLTPLIDKLVTEEFVQREHDNIDRRIVRITLTLSGMNLLENSKKDTLKILNAKLECLDKHDLLGLSNALTDLSRILQKLP